LKYVLRPILGPPPLPDFSVSRQPTRIALAIEYQGTHFVGWQAQAGARTVQGVVEYALQQVADHPVGTVCAGRTDAGVHATAQVVHFDAWAERSPRSWVLGANAHLPPGVSVIWAQPVAPDFHARFSATGRHYRYLILNRRSRPALLADRVCWECRPLSLAPMQEAAGYLIGEHDFSAYRAIACQAKRPVRHVRRLELVRNGDLVVLDIEANAFLHHMVRNIAGVLLGVGVGARPPVWAREVLDARDRTLGGITASAQGLYLVGVQYPKHYGLPSLPGAPLIC
jgi:tRNA pseudouridine38-40 synthase